MSKQKSPITDMVLDANMQRTLRSKAIAQVMKQLDEGTCPASTVNIILQMDPERTQIEKENLYKKGQVLDAKTKALDETGSEKQAYLDAINAMSRYEYNPPN